MLNLNDFSIYSHCLKQGKELQAYQRPVRRFKLELSEIWSSLRVLKVRALTSRTECLFVRPAVDISGYKIFEWFIKIKYIKICINNRKFFQFKIIKCKKDYIVLYTLVYVQH